MLSRQIAPIGLVLAMTVAGFVLARALGERDVERASKHRADVAVAEIRGRVAQGSDLAESLRGFMVDHVSPGVTNGQFVDIGSRWLAPAGLPAAAWVKRVPGSTRLRATLATRVPPIAVPGLDLGAAPSFSEAAARAARHPGPVATRLERLGDGTRGLYIVAAAPRRTGRKLEPGLVALFVPASWLLEPTRKSRSSGAVELRAGGAAAGNLGHATPVGSTFSALGRRFQVLVPKGAVRGPAALLPWIILGAGLVLSALAGVLGVSAARRVRAQRDADRIFNLAPELIAVAGFDGCFRRANPALQALLGYSEAELIGRPLLDFVHADDRARTEERTRALRDGAAQVAFENRNASKDGAYRWLEWTVTPVRDEQIIYAVARDVTERKSLADEQAALRRVATLVARGVSPAETFAAVVEEVARLFGAGGAVVARFEPDGAATVIVGVGQDVGEVTAGTRWEPGDPMAEPAGFRREERRPHGTRSVIGSPIMVEGRVWGTIVMSATGDPLPPDTERRMASFAGLVATAVANAESRAELTASRARVVTAADETRRRIERDLHDGAQQQLVSLGLGLRAAVEKLPPELAEVREELSATARGLAASAEELRELSRGIHPAILSAGGLAPALKTLARRSAVPVQLTISVDRPLPEHLEVAAYYVVSEALTNAAKHAHASEVTINVATEDSTIVLVVRDDGVGGADPERGSGLTGLRDRVEALGGTLALTSAAGEGTSLRAAIPIDEAEGLA
jgi:PAS domain S-box-containing protein